MKLDKKIYTNAEVKEILRSVKTEYDIKFNEQQALVKDLKNENAKMHIELENFYNKNDIIINAVQNATHYAMEIEENANLKFNAEVESLKRFSNKWRGYFSYIYKKYPLYDVVKKSKETFDKLCIVLSMTDDRKIVNDFNSVLDDNCADSAIFDPKKKIEDYINASGDNGFNLNEVLNPGELNLEELCKELGLTEDDSKE